MRGAIHIQTAITPERCAALVVDSGAISVALELSLAQLDGLITALQRVRADLGGGVVLLGPNGAPVAFEHRQAELEQLDEQAQPFPDDPELLEQLASLERIAATGSRGG